MPFRCNRIADATVASDRASQRDRFRSTRDTALRGARGIALTLAFAGTAAAAQSANEACGGSLGPDRPGFSTGTTVLSSGCRQIEFGAQATHDDAPFLRDTTAPMLLFRLGVGTRWELRGAWDGLSWTNSGKGRKRGANDGSLGVKVRLLDGPAFALALLGEVSLPTGSREISSKGYDPGMGLLWNLTVNDKDSLSGTVETASLSDGDRRSEETSVAVDFSRAFDARWGGFVEVYAARDAGLPVATTFDGGITYLVDDDLQVDVNAGIGLNDGADGRFIGTGVAWRF